MSAVQAEADAAFARAKAYQKEAHKVTKVLVMAAALSEEGLQQVGKWVQEELAKFEAGT